MQVSFDRKPVDNHYTVTLSIVGLNAREQEQLAALGSFLVDVGGSFVDGLVSFSLPTKEVRCPENFPQKVVFSIEELTATVASDRAAAWESVMEGRLQTALTTWLATDAAAGTSLRNVTINPAP